MNRTRNQHYIPNKSYLDYFVDKSLKPNTLWVYTNKSEVLKDPETATFTNITPINLCKQAYLYETPRLPVNTIEKVLQSIENNYKHVLDSKIIPKKPLTANDKTAVALFISTLEQRTPLNKENSDSFITDVKDKVAHMEEAHGMKEKSKLHRELDDAEMQNLMFTRMLLTATQMNKYQVTDMLFLSPEFDDEELFFITSDFPVSMIDFSLMNSFYPPTPLDATVEVTVPLTPKITLLVNHLGLNGYRGIDHNYVWEINNRTLHRSNKFIISPKKFGDRFDRNTKRFPQSFVVMFLSDYISKRRSRRTDTYMKNTVKKVIRSLANDLKKLDNKVTDIVGIRPNSKREYEWFIRALKLLGNVLEESQDGQTIALKRAIFTNAGAVDKVKVIKPTDKTDGRDNTGDLV